MAKTKKIVIGTLILSILAASFIISLGENVQIKVEKTKSTFSVRLDNGSLSVAGVEYNSLYNGSKKLTPSNITVFYFNDSKMVTITREAMYANGARVQDIYTFDGNADDVRLFPISHSVGVERAKGLIYRYEVKNLEYNGVSKTLKNNSLSFGKNMVVEWQGGYSSAKIAKGTLTSTLTINYPVSSDSEQFSIRLFDPPNEEKWIESFTSDTRTVCVNNHCNTQIYSNIQFIEQDGGWVQIDQARSLKGTGIKCIVEKSKTTDPDAVCDDWNYTHIKLANITSKVAGEIPVKTVPKEGAEKISAPLTFSKAGDKKSQTFAVKYGEELHLGDTSTVIIIQNAGSGTLADAYLSEQAPSTNQGTASTLRIGNISSSNYFFIMKSNISIIPLNANITDAVVNITYNANFLDAGENYTVSPFIVYENFSWNETNIVYNTRPTADNFTEHRGLNVTITPDVSANGKNETFNVTVAVKSWFESGNTKNITFYFAPHTKGGNPGSVDYVVFESKEATTAGNRPRLQITYDLITIPEVYCYQEHANQSNSSAPCGLAGGNYTLEGPLTDTLNNSIDGDYSSVGGSEVFNQNNITISYLKPSNATNQSLWRVKSALDFGLDQGTNYSIPSSCWSNQNLTFRMELDNTLVQTRGYCLSGNSYQLIFTDNVGAAVYDEAMWWYINNTGAKIERCTCPNGLGKNWGIEGEHACVLQTACSIVPGKLVFLSNGTLNISADLNTSGIKQRFSGFWIHKNDGVTIRK